MNRNCLHCGAPLESGVCSACGLDLESGAYALRKKLLNRLAIFLLGAIAFFPAIAYYPPLELDIMLIFLGTLFFFSLGLGIWLDRRTRRQEESEVQKRIFFALVPVPWLLAALIFFNGWFDSSTLRDQPTTVVSRFAMPGVLRNSRLVVRSWRAGRSIERVPVSRDDYGRFADGDEVVVRVGDGLVGIPWVYGVFRK